MRKELKFNYPAKFMNVRQSWFKENGLYSKLGYKVFYTYLKLFKFWIIGQEYDYTFLCSIDKLRKETGYAANEIVEHLKLLKKEKIIKMMDLSRWDMLLVDGKLDCNRLLTIVADIPSGIDEVKSEVKSEDQYFATVYFNTMNRYAELGIEEKGFGVYCLIASLSVDKGKAWMTIENMAEALGFNKDSLLKLIHEMNRSRLLYSKYEVEKVKGRDGKEIKRKKFEHYILFDADGGEREKLFLENYGDGIRANVNRWNRKVRGKGEDSGKGNNIEMVGVGS